MSRSSAEIAGLFYQQSHGNELVLSSKQLQWLESVRQEEREGCRDSVDSIPPANVEINGRIIASYNVEYVNRQKGICKMTFRKYKGVGNE